MLPHEDLRALIERFGVALLDDAGHLRAVLDDVWGDEDVPPGQLNSLLDAVRFGAVERYRTLTAAGGRPIEVVEQVAIGLAETRGAGDTRSSRWAVLCWAHALGADLEPAGDSFGVASSSPTDHQHQAPEPVVDTTPLPGPVAASQAETVRDPRHRQSPGAAGDHPADGAWSMETLAPRRKRKLWIWGAVASLVTVATGVGIWFVAYSPADDRAAKRPNAGTAYVINSGSQTVSVIEPGSDRVSAALSADSVLTWVAVAPTGTPNAGTVYVTGFDQNSGDGSVSVFEPGSDRVSATVKVGLTPVRVAVAPKGTPDAGTVYVTNYASGSGAGSVSVIEPGSDRVSATIAVGPGPLAIEIAPGGTPNEGTVYVGNFGLGRTTGSVSVIEPGSDRVSTTITVGQGPSGLAVAPPGTPNAGSVYVSNFGSGSNTGSVSVIEPGSDRVSATIKTGKSSVDVAVGPTGAPNAGTVYVTNHGPRSGSGSGVGSVSVIEPGSDRVSATIKAGEAPSVVAAPKGAPNAGTVYVTNNGPDSGSVLVIKSGSVRVSATITVGEHPSKLAVAPEGAPNAGTVFVMNVSDTGTEPGSVSVIDPETDQVSATIKVGFEPSAAAVAP